MNSLFLKMVGVLFILFSLIGGENISPGVKYWLAGTGTGLLILVSDPQNSSTEIKSKEFEDE